VLDTMIGPYRIVRKISQGGMGVVYEARHDAIERRVAIKVLHADLSANQEVVSRFFNEAKAVNRIDHPGIVQCHDFGILADGTAFIVMEYLKGETLSRRSRRMHDRMPLADIMRLVRQIAAALTAAHAKNIVHRDLKPDKVIPVEKIAKTSQLSSDKGAEVRSHPRPLASATHGMPTETHKRRTPSSVAQDGPRSGSHICLCLSGFSMRTTGKCGEKPGRDLFAILLAQRRNRGRTVPLRNLCRSHHLSFSWIPTSLLTLTFCDDERIRTDHRTWVMLQSRVQSPLIFFRPRFHIDRNVSILRRCSERSNDLTIGHFSESPHHTVVSPSSNLLPSWETTYRR